MPPQTTVARGPAPARDPGCSLLGQVPAHAPALRRRQDKVLVRRDQLSAPAVLPAGWKRRSLGPHGSSVDTLRTLIHQAVLTRSATNTTAPAGGHPAVEKRQQMGVDDPSRYSGLWNQALTIVQEPAERQHATHARVCHEPLDRPCIPQASGHANSGPAPPTNRARIRMMRPSLGTTPTPPCWTDYCRACSLGRSSGEASVMPGCWLQH